MKQTRDLLKNSGSTQAMRFIQSFSNSELDASKPDDWKKANQMGMELAQKIAPNNQFAVYTHLDGKGHKLHNHLVMNMPDLKTGKKYHQNNDWERVTKLNDEVIKNHGLMSLEPAKNKQVEKKTMAERQLQAKNEYVWKDDLRNQIDQVMLETGNRFITSKNQFSDVLKQKGIIYRERGKNSCSFEFKDKNDKLRIIRGTNLGTDYTKGAIENGLESNKVTRNVEVAGEIRPEKREFNEINRSLQRQESGIGDPIRRGERQHNLIAARTKKESPSDERLNHVIQQFSSKIERINNNLTNFINGRLEKLRDRLKRIRKQSHRKGGLDHRRRRLSILKQGINEKNKFITDRSERIKTLKRTMPYMSEAEFKINATRYAIEKNPNLFKTDQKKPRQNQNNFKSKGPSLFRKR